MKEYEEHTGIFAFYEILTMVNMEGRYPDTECNECNWLTTIPYSKRHGCVHGFMTAFAIINVVDFYL